MQVNARLLPVWSKEEYGMGCRWIEEKAEVLVVREEMMCGEGERLRLL